MGSSKCARRCTREKRRPPALPSGLYCWVALEHGTDVGTAFEHGLLEPDRGVVPARPRCWAESERSYSTLRGS